MSGGTRYYEYDVAADGNCYYRSIYNAAKYHREEGVLQRLLGCFELSYDMSEDKFSEEIRKKIGERIDSGIFETMAQIEMEKQLASATTNAQRASIQQESNFVKGLYDAARNDVELFNAIIAEMSTQLQDAIRKEGGASGIARHSEEAGINLLKKLIKNTISKRDVYASEVDIKIVNFILESCGLYSVQVNPDAKFKSSNVRNRLMMPDMWPPVNFYDELTPLYIRRVNENHYHFFAPEDKKPVNRLGRPLTKMSARSVGNLNNLSVRRPPPPPGKLTVKIIRTQPPPRGAGSAAKPKPPLPPSARYLATRKATGAAKTIKESRNEINFKKEVANEYNRLISLHNLNSISKNQNLDEYFQKTYNDAEAIVLKRLTNAMSAVRISNAPSNTFVSSGYNVKPKPIPKNYRKTKRGGRRINERGA